MALNGIELQIGNKIVDAISKLINTKSLEN